MGDMELPDILKQESSVVKPKLRNAVAVDGIVYRVSVHARRQYRARVGEATDEGIVLSSLDDPRAVWVEHEDGGYVLVTYRGSR